MPKSKRISLPPLPPPDRAHLPTDWVKWASESARTLADVAAREGAVPEEELHQLAVVLASVAPSGSYRRGGAEARLNSKKMEAKLDFASDDAWAAWRLLSQGTIQHGHLAVIQGHLRRACRLAHGLLEAESDFDDRAMRRARLDESWCRCLKHVACEPGG